MLNPIQLGRLLKFLSCNSRRQERLIRTDISTEKVAKEKKEAGEKIGFDFYVSFWKAAKQHVFGEGDLHAMVEKHIASSPRKSKTYRKLLKGFLGWWDAWRRGTNSPFRKGRAVIFNHEVRDLGAIIKIGNVLTIKDGEYEEYIIYPYFAKDIGLSADAARLGLWVLTNIPALQGQILPENIIILDVVRGVPFSLGTTPLHGNEESSLREQYRYLLEKREALSAAER